MLINVENMRLLKNKDADTRFSLVKKNIERFFRDYIYYFNVYDRKELIIDHGYLPFHYLDGAVIEKIVDLLERELGYGVVIVKINNTGKIGYNCGDMINIRLYDIKETTVQEVDKYFNQISYQSLYSTFHGYNNIYGNEGEKVTYFSCLEAPKNFLLNAQQNNINNTERN